MAEAVHGKQEPRRRQPYRKYELRALYDAVACYIRQYQSPLNYAAIAVKLRNPKTWNLPGNSIYEEWIDHIPIRRRRLKVIRSWSSLKSKWFQCVRRIVDVGVEGYMRNKQDQARLKRLAGACVRLLPQGNNTMVLDQLIRG